MVGYLTLGLVAGLAAVERKGFLQAMLSRPIALAPVAGFALGDAQAGLLVAAPLELLWLGAVNLGAALPDHESIGTASIAGGAALGAAALRGAGLAGPAVLPAAALIALVVCAPLAVAGRRAERLVERFNERLYARAERDLLIGDLRAAARVNLYGVAMPFAIAFALAPVGAALAALVAMALARMPGALPLLATGWMAFAAFACAAGARSLRVARGGSAYFAALAAGLLLLGAAVYAGGRG